MITYIQCIVMTMSSAIMCYVIVLIFHHKRVIDCEGDQKKLFSLIHSLLGSKKTSIARIYQLFYFDIYNNMFL